MSTTLAAAALAESGDDLLGNSSLAGSLTTTTVASTQPATTTDFFKESVGTLFDFEEMAKVDWDEVTSMGQLTPREYTSWNALNIARVALSSWILASHLAIVVFLVTKGVLRAQPKNLLILNVALANILMAVFVMPVKLHFILNPDSVDCNLAVGWHFITDYFQSCLSLFAVFCLVVERFIYVYTEKKQKNLLRNAQKLLTVLLMAFPWLASCLILIPTFLAGGLVARSTDPDSCLFKVNEDYLLACQILAFVPASLGVFVFAPFTGILDCLRPKSCFYTPLTPRLESVTVTAIVTLASIACEAPYGIIRVLMMRMECNSPDCLSMSEGLTIAMWLRVSKAAVFPFIWLAYTDIRDAMKCAFDMDACCGDDSDDEFDEDEKRNEELDQGIPLTRRM